MIDKTPGFLRVTLRDNQLNASFASDARLHLNVAVLGFGVITNVESGENAGKTFSEDFIVLDTYSAVSNIGEWSLNIKQPSFKAQRYALAVWVNSAENLQAIQATGGWLD